MLSLKIISSSLLVGVVWCITYIFIRKLLNPAIKKPLKKPDIYNGIFGGIAATCSTILIQCITLKFIDPLPDKPLLQRASEEALF